MGQHRVPSASYPPLNNTVSMDSEHSYGTVTLQLAPENIRKILNLDSHAAMFQPCKSEAPVLVFMTCGMGVNMITFRSKNHRQRLRALSIRWVTYRSKKFNNKSISAPIQ